MTTPDWLAKAMSEGRVTGLEPKLAAAAKKIRGHWSTPTEYRGVKYRSKSEARRAAELDLLVAGGEVLFWAYAPRFELGCPENVYISDFRVTGRDGSVYVEEVKAIETEKWLHNLKLWRRYGPCPLHILRPRRGGGWDRRVVPGGAA